LSNVYSCSLAFGIVANVARYRSLASVQYFYVVDLLSQNAVE